MALVADRGRMTGKHARESRLPADCGPMTPVINRTCVFTERKIRQDVPRENETGPRTTRPPLVVDVEAVASGLQRPRGQTLPIGSRVNRGVGVDQSEIEELVVTILADILRRTLQDGANLRRTESRIGRFHECGNSCR